MRLSSLLSRTSLEERELYRVGMSKVLDRSVINKFNHHGLSKEAFVKLECLIIRPGVAGAVLQTPLYLTHSLGQ